MTLSGKDIKELRLALTDAFPSKASLKRLIRESDIGINLEEIVFGENLNDVVSEIIQLAESHNKLDILIDAAYEENPGNAKLKAVKKNPFLLISLKYWQNIVPVLESIINTQKVDFIGNVCRLTLINIQKYKGNVESEFPESVNPDIDKLEKIFLQKRIYNDREAPAIIDFAERLATKVESPYNEQLNQWVEDVAEKLNIKRSKYSSTQSLEDSSQETLQSYLLVVVEPKGDNKVSLTAELIPNYPPRKNFDISEPINLEAEKPVIDCLFTEVAYNIYRFIEKAREPLHGKSYDLTIEVFLPFQYLHENIEFQEINIQNKIPKFIGEDNRFVVRSFERYDKTEEYLSKLIKRWRMLEDFINNSLPDVPDIKNKFYSLDKIENRDFPVLSKNMKSQQILGLKVNCCLPKLEEDKRKFFSYAFKAGIPIFLWTRSNDIRNIDTEFDKLLSTEALRNYLVDSVYQLRQDCIESNKEECLGYHIGFLCDNPNRLPSRFMPTYSY